MFEKCHAAKRRLVDISVPVTLMVSAESSRCHFGIVIVNAHDDAAPHEVYIDVKTEYCRKPTAKQDGTSVVQRV